jgi:hypothetical protein
MGLCARLLAFYRQDELELIAERPVFVEVATGSATSCSRCLDLSQSIGRSPRQDSEAKPVSTCISRASETGVEFWLLGRKKRSGPRHSSRSESYIDFVT